MVSVAATGADQSALGKSTCIVATDKLWHVRIAVYAMSCKDLIWQENSGNTALELGGLNCATSWNAVSSRNPAAARKASTYVSSSSASKVSIEGTQAKE